MKGRRHGGSGPIGGFTSALELRLAIGHDTVMPPIILSLIAGFIIGSITLAGVVYTQRRTAKREDERWAIDQRRDAHLAFLEEQAHLNQWLSLYTRVGGNNIEEPLPGWTKKLYQLLVAVEIFGSAEAASSAHKLFEATQDMLSGATGDLARADLAYAEYRKAVQRDLSIDVTQLSTWADTTDPKEWAKPSD